MQINNPYIGVPLDQETRISVKVSTGDYNFIKCIRPAGGTVTGLLGTFWKEAVRVCQEKGINDITNENEFEKLFSNFTIIPKDELEQLRTNAATNTKQSTYGGFPNGPAGGFVPHSLSPNVTGGAKEPGVADSTTPAESTDIQSRNGGKRKGATTTTSGKKGKKGKATSGEGDSK